MTWPIWLVVGLVVIAGLITVVYALWMQRLLGYVEFSFEAPTRGITPSGGASERSRGLLPNEQVIPLAAIYSADGCEVMGYVVVYRDANIQAPWQLADKLAEKVAPAALAEVPVVKEPGYNSFRIYHKNRELLLHAARAWSRSIFHALVMPLEVALRSSLFPLQTMVDFVSHERRVAAGIVASPWLAERPALLRLIEKNVSIVEAYNSIFVRFTDDVRFHFGDTLLRGDDASANDDDASALSRSANDDDDSALRAPPTVATDASALSRSANGGSDASALSRSANGGSDASEPDFTE